MTETRRCPACGEVLTPGAADGLCTKCLLKAGLPSQAGEPARVQSATVERPITEKPGDTMGPYKLLQPIGEGGFGVVYMAEQLRPVRRKVALKIIKPGMDTKEVVARFDAERQAVALMDHPNIAKVFDAGATESGRPYFVMELVRGVPLTEYCDKNHLPIHERLKLFVDVCHALQHAHQKGIIHRDLKSSNIMVTLHDGKPVPKVIDFGISKALSQQLTEKTLFTAYGQMVGTPAYMSPEQAEMSGLDIDTRSDIYSLGVLLYELLTGSTPLDAKRLRAAGYAEMQRIIREEEPLKPSARLTSLGEEATVVSGNRGVDAKKLGQFLRGDLDWIVMKSLEKDRERRYETANGFAADVQRYLSDDPVTACPPSLSYRLQKFGRKNKGVLAAAGTLAGVLLVASILSSWLAFKAKQAERSANQQRIVAQQSRDAALSAQQREAEQRAQAEASQADALEARDESRQRLVQLHIANGARLMDQGQLVDSLPWFAEALNLDDSDDRLAMHRIRISTVLRKCPKLVHVWLHDGAMGGEFSRDGNFVVTGSRDSAQVWNAHTGDRLASLKHEDDLHAGSLSPDGRRLCTVGRDKTAVIWEVATGKPVTPPLQHAAEVWLVEFSPDGRHVITADSDGTAIIWNANTGEPTTPPLQHTARVVHVSFSPDGRYVVTASADHSAKVWQTATGQPVSTLKHDDEVSIAAFSPDGSRVVTGSLDHTARVWETESGKPVTPPLKISGGQVFSAEFSQDGRRVVTGGGTESIVWDATSGELVSRVKQGSWVIAAEFSPDARHVVTAGWDHTARIWDADSGDLAFPPLTHGGIVFNATYSRDGRRLLTVSDRGVVRIWDLATSDTATPTFKHDDVVYHASFSPDSQRLVTASLDRTARVWNTVDGTPISPPLRHNYAVLHAVFSPDGRYVLTASGDENIYGQPGNRGEARLWDATTGELVLPPLPHDGSVGHGAFSPDGARILTATGTKSRFRSPKRGDARIWDRATGQLLAVLNHERCVRYAEFDADGRYVVTASDDGTARLWDAATGKAISKPLKHAHRVPLAAFSPDGRHVVTASWGPGFDERGTATVWDVNSGEPVCPPIVHGDGVLFVSFSPDNRYVATASEDFTARVWNATTGEAVTPPLRHADHVYRASFSNDGRYLLTASRDGRARVWDAATGQPITPQLRHGRHGDSVRHAEFSKDGSRVVTTCLDGTVQVWELPLGESPREDLVRLAQLRAGHKVDPTGGFVPLEPHILNDNLQRLRSAYPEHFVPSPQELLAWHHREVEDCLRKRRWSAALPHLDAIIEARPNEWMPYARGRASVHAELGNWMKADDDLSRAILLGADLEQVWHQQAVARLAAENIEGYQRTCADLFERFRNSEYPATANRVAWTATLAPGADEPEILGLAQRAVEIYPNDPTYLTTLAAALYRTGQFDDAVQKLNKASSLQAEDEQYLPWDFAMSTSGQSETWLLLAMAHARQGDLKAARPWLAKATQEKPDADGDVWRRQTYQLLLREAGEVLHHASNSAALETSANSKIIATEEDSIRSNP